MRLTTKPGLSFTTTGVLPSLIAHRVRLATASRVVAGAWATSTSGILWTGLKKCRAATRPGCASPSCTLATPSEEVLVASSVSGWVWASSSRKTFRFNSRSSMTASTTRSTSWNPTQAVVPLTAARRLLRLGLRQNSPADCLREQGGDLERTGGEGHLVDLADDDLAAAHRRQLGDAGPHGPAPTTPTRLISRRHVRQLGRHLLGQFHLEEQRDEVAAGGCGRQPADRLALVGQPGGHALGDTDADSLERLARSRHVVRRLLLEDGLGAAEEDRPSESGRFEQFLAQLRRGSCFFGRFSEGTTGRRTSHPSGPPSLATTASASPQRSASLAPS